MTTLAERYVVVPRQLQARRSVRTAKLTSPARPAAYERAAATCGFHCGGGAAPAAAGAASGSSTSAIRAMRRTSAQASLRRK